MTILDSTKELKKHFTATGYVVNKSRTKMLLIHHNKLDKWLPPGGHLDENEIPHEAAIREVFEETGVQAVLINLKENDLSLNDEVDTQLLRPYAMMYQIIPKSSKDEEHIHLDLAYALEASEDAIISAEYKEVHDVQWLTKSDILSKSDIFDSVKGFAELFLKSD